MRSRPPVILALGSVALLGACQAILNFEDFEEAPAAGGSAGTSAAGTGGSKGGSGGAAGSANGGTTPGGAGDTGASGDTGQSGGPGGDAGGLGVDCSGNTDCTDPLVCLYGYCRDACEDDTDCGAGSTCLVRSETGGGCRLDSETCEDGPCENGALACGIDGTCRIACSTEDSCDASTQRCIAGTCVSTVGEGAAAWECGDTEDGELTCNGKQLSVCNVLGPGLVSVDSCPNSAICEASLPSPPAYDDAHPPECTAGCGAEEPYCDGTTLLVCDDQGSGPIDGGEDCATEELCDASADDGQTTCNAPACDEGEARCGGAQTSLVVEACNDGRTGFEIDATCASAKPQCNPGGAQCFALDIDATEVSMTDYAAWLALSPDPGSGQPDGCAFNTSFALDAACLTASSVACSGGGCARPAVCMDWCDAYAYCAAQGRRLCGKIGGGMTPLDRAGDPGVSQWMNACSAGGQYDWSSARNPPLGADDCWYSGSSDGKPYASGSHAKCTSLSPGYETFYDLSGNVEEWEDSCDKVVTAPSAGASDACATRGGSIASANANEIKCGAERSIPHARNETSPTVGFRCCGD